MIHSHTVKPSALRAPARTPARPPARHRAKREIPQNRAEKFTTMNIVITLPRPLIDKILTGEKKLEVRKSAPLYFNKYSDCVYVCEKGKSKIVAILKIARFRCLKFGLVNIGYAQKHAAVPLEWLFRYLKGHDIFWTWEINEYMQLETPIALADLEDVKCPPQSYVYTQVRLQNLNLGQQ